MDGIFVIIQVCGNIRAAVEGKKTDIVVLKNQGDDVFLGLQPFLHCAVIYTGSPPGRRVGGKEIVKRGARVCIGQEGHVLSDVGQNRLPVGIAQVRCRSCRGDIQAVLQNGLRTEGVVILPAGIGIEGGEPRLEARFFCGQGHGVGAAEEHILVKEVKHIIEGVAVREIRRVFSKIVPHGILFFQQLAVIQTADDRFQVRIVLKGNDQVVVDLLIGAAGIRNLYGVHAEQGVDLRNLEIFGHGGAGNKGVVIKVLADAVVLTPLIVQRIEIAPRIRLVIMKIGIDPIDIAADHGQHGRYQDQPPGQPIF